MRRKITPVIILLIALLAIMNTSGALSVGVKKGDWVEYAVTHTGTIPEGYDASSWSIEVLDIQRTEINFNLTFSVPNSTPYSAIVTYNFENGNLSEDYCIIPANLKEGDIVYDKNVGNITIGSVETRTYSGVTRTVVVNSTEHVTNYWDQSTGVILEAIITFSDYTLTSKVDKTNLWQPQPAVDQTVLIAVAFVAIIIIAAAIILVAKLRKKRN